MMSFLRVKPTASKSNIPSFRHNALNLRYFTVKTTAPNVQTLHTAEEQAILDEFAAESLRRKDTVILHGGPRFTDGSMSYIWKQYGYDDLSTALLPSCYATTGASMFSTRIEAYLKYNKINYVYDDTITVIPKPMHKTPWITFQGQHTADTQLIIQHVLDPHFNIDNDSHLDSTQRAVSVAFRLAMDKQMYWFEVYRRYVEPYSCHHYFRTIFYQHPTIDPDAWAQQFAGLLKEQLHAQGTGRYDGDTVYLMMKELIDGIVTYMGDKPFFFGDTISSIDLVFYGHLAAAYALPFPYPLCEKYDGELPHKEYIIDYIERVSQQCA